MRVVLRDGEELRLSTAAPLGSLANPMPDAALGAKFTGLAAPVLGTQVTVQLLEHAWALESIGNLAWLGEIA
jgi:hypothetical protein